MSRRPFGLGVAIGIALPALVLLALALLGRLEPYLSGSRAYALLPLFAPLGIPAFLVGWKLFDLFQVPRMGGSLSLGMLVGGSLSAAVLLFVSSAERPLVNRVIFSVFGAPLLCGFWLWIGSLLGYARQQQRATHELFRSN